MGDVCQILLMQTPLWALCFDHIAENSIPLLDTFTPQDFSNIVWAFVKAGVSHPLLFDKVADAIISSDNLQGFNEQALSNILWAFVNAKVSHPQLFYKVADAIVTCSNLTSFKPQALSNIVWAFSKAEVAQPRLFEKIADSIIASDNLQLFKPQEMSTILWSFVNAKVSHPRLFAKVADTITASDMLKPFKPQALAIVVWAYAKAEEYHPQLFQEIAKASLAKQHEFNAQAIANLLWAFAKAGQIESNLFSSMAPSVEALLPKCNPQALANIAWAYAVADVSSGTLFSDMFVNACLVKSDDFTIEGLNQLYQWNLWQEELLSDAELPPKLLRKCHGEFPSTMPRSSTLKDDVVSCLSSIALEPEADFLTLRGYRLDALVRVKGAKVGVEVDGPSNFVGGNPNGRTILKHRQISNLEGIPVVSVPYGEWNNFEQDNSRKQQYLQSLLGIKN